MAGRFSQIKYLIKKAKEMEIVVEEDDNIKAYRAYRRGTSTTYKTTPVNRDSSRPFTLLPFCTLEDTARYASKMSGRAFASMAQNNITDAKLNIDTTPSTTNLGGTKNTAYAPAKAILFVATGTKTTPKSGITLLEYKKRVGTSYTYPFGRGTEVTQATYPQMCGRLLADLGVGNRNVSFKPERAA